MATEPTIDQLDPVAVAAAESFLVTFLKEQFPDMDLTEGRVLLNLLIRPAALFRVLNQTDITNLRESMSLLAIQQNPAIADQATVDAVLSNYRVTRNPGSFSIGQITIIIQNLLTTPINQGTIFTANGLTYTNALSFVGVTTQAAVVSNQQRLIVPRNDGTFAFTIDVTATAVGQAYNAKRATQFAVNPAPPGIIEAVAAQDFINGTNQETNQELIDRFNLGISPAVFSGRVNIESLLLSKFPNITAQSIVGFGDEEMLRDRHNIFQVSTGGKADLYVRTQALPVSITIQKTATLVDKVNQVWQISISRDDYPGFYTIDAVLPLGSDVTQDSLQITAETRGLDLTPDENDFVPDIKNIVEGAYSRYQTSVFQFIDPNVDTSSLIVNQSTRDYLVFITGMPNIKELQLLASDRSTRNPQADYLVRAPIPIFSSVTLQVLYVNDADAPDAAKIKQAVSAAVNGLGFELGKLPASIIFKAVHGAIAAAGVLVTSPLDILASLRSPDGTILQFRDPNEIDVPDLPMSEITSRTAVFYMDLNGVDVAIQKVPALPV